MLRALQRLARFAAANTDNKETQVEKTKDNRQKETIKWNNIIMKIWELDDDRMILATNTENGNIEPLVMLWASISFRHI